MVVITRKKAGRGNSREEWINHHQKIVQRARQKEASQKKLTESWNNSTKQDIGKKLSVNPARKKSAQEVNDTDITETNRWDTKDTQGTQGIENPTRASEGVNTKGTTTLEMYVETQKTTENTHKSSSNVASETNETQEINPRKHNEQNLQLSENENNKDANLTTDLSTEQINQNERKYKDNPTNVSRHSNKYQEFVIRGQQGYGNTITELDTVEIKQEFLDEVTTDKNEGWEKPSNESESSQSEILEDMMETDSMMSEDSTSDREEEETAMKWQTTQRSGATITKRKCDTAHQTKYKRIQLANEEMLVSVNERQTKESDGSQSSSIESKTNSLKNKITNEDKQRSSEATEEMDTQNNRVKSTTGSNKVVYGYDDSVKVNESNDTQKIIKETKGTVVASSLQKATVSVATQKAASDKQLQGTKKKEVTKITDTTQTESDMEWEELASKLASPNPNRKSISREQNSSVKKTVQKQKYTRFSKFNTVIKTNINRDETFQNIKERGWNMMEQMEKLTTPVKIEYNLTAEVREFNIIQACEELFDTMGKVDPQMKIISSVDKEQLWEVNSPITENEEFERKYQMRQQNFRNGNTKVTIYGVVESQYNINKMKFTDPLRSLLTQRNIWIKPDFYSTKVVNSPGFFTFIHPKLTNKQAFTKYLHNAMTNTLIDQTEQVYMEWREQGNYVEINEMTPVPKFHLETTLRKWGKIQAEVVSLHCSSIDAKYMKYLLAEASSQRHIDKGVFVPSGIHLMEGKQVLTQILQEQNDFNQEIESFQIDGISEEEMYLHTPGNENIEQILLNGPGVQAVEPTYQTPYKGQWTLVVKGKRNQQLTDYIKTNISKIYKNKGGRQPRLVTHQIEKHIPGYKLSFVDQMVSSVGTYAEVLRRRFTQQSTASQQNAFNPMDQADTSTVKVPTAASNGQNRVHKQGSTVETRHASTTTEATTGPNESNKTNRPGINNTSAVTPTEETRTKYGDQTNNTIQDNEIDRTHNGPTRAEVEDWNHQLKTVDDTINSRMERFEQENKQLMQNLEKNIEAQVDRLMERRMKAISSVVGDAVTKKVMVAIERMVNRVKPPESTLESDIQQATITQDSPVKGSEHYHQNTDGKETTEKDMTETTDSTKLMLTELENIEHNQTNINDPTHDTNYQGSETVKS